MSAINKLDYVSVLKQSKVWEKYTDLNTTLNYYFPTFFSPNDRSTKGPIVSLFRFKPLDSVALEERTAAVG